MAESDSVWKADLSDPQELLSLAKSAVELPPDELISAYYSSEIDTEDANFALRKAGELLKRLLGLSVERVETAEEEVERLKEQSAKTQAELARANADGKQARQLRGEVERKTKECEQLREELAQAQSESSGAPDLSSELASARARIRQLEQRLKDSERRGGNTKALEDEAQRKLISRLPELNRSAVKIQARIRGFLSRRKFFEMVDSYVRNTRKISKKELSNETIMKQVAVAAKSRNLTMEQCYRASDSDGDGLVTNEELVRFMNQMRLGLSPAQISRLMLILDEDCSGQVEQQEFYDALSAYQVATEHQRSGARSYAQETLVKFVSVLATRGISPEELFNLCDTNSNRVIDLQELEKFISGLRMGFKEKEVHALMTLLDADHSGSLSLEEFAKHMERGTQAFKLESAMSTNAAPLKRKVNTWMAQTPDLQVNEEIKAIVAKMESRGTSISDAFDKIETDRKGRVSMAGLSRFMNKLFPQLSKEEILRISMSLDLDKDAMLDAGELHQFLATYSQTAKPSLRSTLQQMTQMIQRKQSKIAPFLSKAGIVGANPREEFTRKAMTVFGVSQEQAALVADSLDLKGNGEVATKDLISVLRTYRTDGEEDDPGDIFQVEEVKAAESMSADPRSAANKSIKDFQSYLEENKLQPMHVYKLADKRSLGSVSETDVQTAITKLLPSAPGQMVERFIRALPGKTITKAEFMGLFSPQASAQPAEDSGIPPAAEYKDNMGFTPEALYWLRKLDEAMKLQGQTATQIFSVADTDHDDKISVKELAAALKRMIPSSDLPLEDLPKIMTAIDVNKNQSLEKQEFLLRMQHVRKSNMPQKMLDSYESGLGQRSARVPSARGTDTQEEEKQKPTVQPAKGPVKSMQPAKQPAKPSISIPFSATVLPIKPLVAVPKLSQLILKFQKTITATVDSTFATLPPESLFSLTRFIKCYSVRGGLSETDCTEVFKSLDTHSQSVIPHYAFVVVINSYRNPNEYSEFPIAQNENCAVEIRKAWSQLARNKAKFDAREVFSGISLASDLLPEWDGLVNAWGVFEPQKEQLQSSLSLLSAPKIYHLAAILSSYCDAVALDPVEVVYAGIQMSEISTDACEFFSLRNISPIDTLDHDQFSERIAPIMCWNAVEASTVYSFLYPQDPQPVYHFLTAIDLYRNTLERGVVTKSLVVFPFNGSKKQPRILETIAKIAMGMGGPITRFGVEFSSKLTEQELTTILAKATSVSSQEAQIVFREMRIPPSKTVPVYHLLSVLDSYSPQQLAMQFPKAPLQAISKLMGKAATAEEFLTQRGIPLQTILHPGDITAPFRIAESAAEELFSYIDISHKGGIYAFELAALLDVFQAFRANLGSFPIRQNSSTPLQLKKVFENVAGNMGNQHAYDVYIRRQVFQIDQRIDRPSAVRLFKSELSVEEVAVMFDCLRLGTASDILAYHYLACVESYSTVPMQEEAPGDMNEYGEEGESAPAESPSELFSLVQRLPDRVSSSAYFDSKKIPLEQLFDRRSFISNLQRAEGLSREGIEDIFTTLDETGKGKIFGYQFITVVDMHRSCLSAGELTYSLPELPVASKANKVMAGTLKAIAAELDRTGQSTVSLVTKSGFQTAQSLRLNDLVKVLTRMEPQKVKNLFAAIDFSQKGTILAYHFLAVLETYRDSIPQNQAENPDVPQVKSVASPAPLDNSLKDAFQKLIDFLNGANPRRRPLSPSELFAPFDSNHDGKVSRIEFMKALTNTKCGFTDQQMMALQKEADTDRNDAIDYGEFCRFLTDSAPKKEPPQKPQKRRRPVSDIRGLDVPFASLPEGSFDQAIYKIKQYVRSNAGSLQAIEEVFQKMDTDNAGSLGETEFFLAIERLKIALTPSQKGMLLSKADSNRDSRINYMEFVDFIYDYEYTGAPLEESKYSEQESTSLVQKTMTKRESTTNDPVEDIENYQIDPERDYFRKSNPRCSSIMNNEISALRRCVELIRAAKGKPFRDMDFGPEYGPQSIYWKGTPPNSNFPPVDDLTWKSPREWIDNPSFFTGNIASNDVVQGSLGDCWFIGALSVLATRDELVRGSVEYLKNVSQIVPDVVPGISKGVYPPLFHPFASKGLYVFRFFKDCVWRYVIVDDRLPVYEGGGEPSLVFGSCREPSELWVPLIEKAFAKLHGCYEALGGGLIDDGLVDMTGLVSYKLKFSGQGGYFEVPLAQQGPLADELWDKLMKYKKSGTMMGCSIDGKGIETDVMMHGENTGLLAGHAYGIVDLLYIVNPRARNTKKRHRLIRVRNPWGKREWSGKWSDGSPEMEEFGDLITKELQISGDIDEDLDIKDRDDGTFFMCFKDWRSIFSNFYACVDFEENWSGIRFTDEWTKSTAGGVPMTASKDASLRFARNPQFILTLKRRTEVFLSLLQNDGRYQPNASFPYQEFIRTACVSIISLKPQEDGVECFDSTKIVKLSPLKLHREVAIRLELDPGKYAIVPATMTAGETGQFFLSVYFGCEKEAMDIYRRGDPDNKGQLIEEEEEVDPSSITEDIVADLKKMIAFLLAV